MANTISASGILYIRDNGSENQYSTNNSTWFTIPYSGSVPGGVTITNSTPASTLKVIFTTDITIRNVYHYFICGSANIQFGSETLNADGSRPTITISGVSNYVGLISNGTSGADGLNNISIYNLIVTSSGSTQGTDGGWIGRTNFARNASANLIVNCSCIGTINGGGITGAQTARNGGKLTIQGCTSSGTKTSGCGGIVGYSSAGSTGSEITIDRCSDSGDIGGNGGGIVGNSSGINGGSIIVTNSYHSSGTIGAAAGGICGASPGFNGSVVAENCYSNGTINGGGGIFGSSAGGGASGSAIARNCYSTGNITGGGGGIFGASYTTARAFNCYTSGPSSGLPNGGIWQNSTSNATVIGSSNNYAEANAGSSGWKDTNVTLTGKPVSSSYGSTWSQIDGVDTPYVLSISGYSPYSTTLGTTYSETITAGGSSSPAVVPGYTYKIISINGDAPPSYTYISFSASTGAITASTETPAGSYTIKMYASINPYSITDITLGVNALPAAASTTEEPTCCPGTLDLTGIDYRRRNEILSGNMMIANLNARRAPISYSEMIQMKMAYAQKRV